MVHEAMIVETALPTMSSDTGKVAMAGFAARLRPRIPPAVTTANQPVTPTACANSRIAKLWLKSWERMAGPCFLPKRIVETQRHNFRPRKRGAIRR